MRQSLVLAGIVVLTACASAPAAPGASPTNAGPVASANPGRGWPPGCEDIDLRSPAGERVDLTGEWAGSGVLAGESESAWLQQVGDCVYGSVVGSRIFGDQLAGETITNLSGRVGPDFEIDFDVLIVSQRQFLPLGTYSTMAMKIEWDAEGRIRLREDREPGDVAARCAQNPQTTCPSPVIWYRIDDGPPS